MSQKMRVFSTFINGPWLIGRIKVSIVCESLQTVDYSIGTSSSWNEDVN